MTRKSIIAVVDDDRRLIESLEELLESAGYGVRCFSSANSLIADGFSDVDALITDIGLPGIDGFELRHLATKSRPELPVFLITGRHEIADQSRAQGISGFFRKPFDGQALLSALDTALHGREMEQDNED